MAETNTAASGGRADWNVAVSTDKLTAASTQMDEIINQIDNAKKGIESESEVIKQNWIGLAAEKFSALKNANEELFNDYMDDLLYESFRLKMVSEGYLKREGENLGTAQKLRSSIF